MIIVKRPKSRDRGKLKFFTERMIDWPAEAVSAERQGPREPWRFTFRSDVLRMKRERMERNLAIKRESDLSCRRALYVWVFWCPGVAGFAFQGWWTYLTGIGGKRYHGGGVKGKVAEDLLSRIMQMFPVDNPYPLLGPVSADEWMPLFARKHQRGLWCGKPQGKAAVWATVDNDRVLEIANA